jgi:hypothetical protein
VYVFTPVKVQPKILRIFLRELCVIYMGQRARFSACGKCYMNTFGFIGFYYPFFNQLWIAVKLVCSLCEATNGSLSDASTAVS